MYRLIRWIVLVTLAYVIVLSLPSAARYVRMRAM
jgi:hypothetical protein